MINKKFSKILVGSVTFVCMLAGYSYAIPSQHSIFNDNSVLIYGSQNKSTSKDETIIAYNLKKQMKSFINMLADEKVSDSNLKSSNLIILSADKSNRILNFTSLPYVKSNFPVNFNENYFSFGTKNYNKKKEGIVFIYPSPYNAKNYSIIYYANSVEGLANLAKNAKLTNENEYQIIDESGQVSREGKFNKTNFNWRYDPNLDKDYEKGIPGSKDEKFSESPDFRFYYTSNSYPAKKIDFIKDQYEDYYKRLAKITNTKLNGKAQIHFFDNSTERENAAQNSNLSVKEIFAVYNNREDTGLAEFARFYFNNVMNFSNDKIVEASFTTYAQDLKSFNLDPKIVKLYNQNKIPSLLSLIKSDTVTPDSEIIVGSFTKYLINRYGIDNYKEIITRAKTVDQSSELTDFTNNLLTSFANIEREWRYILRDLARKYNG